MAVDVGDRVWVGGSYWPPPKNWLCGRDRVFGTVVAWIALENEELACVVALDGALDIWDPGQERLTGDTTEHLVLQLRYVGQQWEDTGTVHVVACIANPENGRWPILGGTWVESHGTYTRV